MAAKLIFKKTIILADDLFEPNRMFFNEKLNILYTVGAPIVGGTGYAPLYQISVKKGEVGINYYAINYLIGATQPIYCDEEFNILYASNLTTNVWSFYICNNDLTILTTVPINAIFGAPGATNPKFLCLRNGDYLIISYNNNIAWLNIYTGLYKTNYLTFADSIIDIKNYTDNLFVLTYNTNLILFAYDVNNLGFRDNYDVTSNFTSLNASYRLKIFLQTDLYDLNDPYQNNVDTLTIYNIGPLPFNSQLTLSLQMPFGIYPLSQNFYGAGGTVVMNGVPSPTYYQIMGISLGLIICMDNPSSNTNTYINPFVGGFLVGYQTNFNYQDPMGGEWSLPSTNRMLDLNGVLIRSLGYDVYTQQTAIAVYEVVTDQFIYEFIDPNYEPVVYPPQKLKGGLVNHSRPISTIGKYKS